MVEVSTMSNKQLMELYGVKSWKTWKNWLEPIREVLNNNGPAGKLYTPKQVQIIFDFLGKPD